jgi:hypothetical protein
LHRCDLTVSKGLTGTLQASEMELRSFAAGGVAIRWRRIRVAPLNMRMVLYGRQVRLGAAPAWTDLYDTMATGRPFIVRAGVLPRRTGR